MDIEVTKFSDVWKVTIDPMTVSKAINSYCELDIDDCLKVDRIRDFIMIRSLMYVGIPYESFNDIDIKKISFFCVSPVEYSRYDIVSTKYLKSVGDEFRKRYVPLSLKHGYYNWVKEQDLYPVQDIFLAFSVVDTKFGRRIFQFTPPGYIDLSEGQIDAIVEICTKNKSIDLMSAEVYYHSNGKIMFLKSII